MKNQIPEQQQGGSLDTIAKAEFSTRSAAIEFYQTAKHRLINVSSWAEICELPLSTFTLTNDSGEPLKRTASEGDYLKIDIPGPGTHTGDGFDWVKIEKITEENTSEGMTTTLQARPAANPTNKDQNIAHFFTSQATSSFQVKQIGNTVFAEEHGRNEVPNTDTSNVGDNIRNTLVGWSAKIGLSYPQWKSLVKGIINTEPTQ